MEKNIKILVMTQKVIFYTCCALYVVLFVACEKGWLPIAGSVEPKSQTEYTMQLISVGGVLLVLPLAMKLFVLNTTKNLKRMNFDEALANYRLWYIIRKAMIELVALYGLVAYSASSNISCGICSLMAMCCMLLTYPSEKKVKDYLDNLNREDN